MTSLVAFTAVALVFGRDVLRHAVNVGSDVAYGQRQRHMCVSPEVINFFSFGGDHGRFLIQSRTQRRTQKEEERSMASFLQGVSIACYASPVLAIVGMSLCLSVRPSVRDGPSVRPSVSDVRHMHASIQ